MVKRKLIETLNETNKRCRRGESGCYTKKEVIDLLHQALCIQEHELRIKYENKTQQLLREQSEVFDIFTKDNITKQLHESVASYFS